jgi:hypothetical protein
MNERDNYCDYLGSNKTWKDHATLLNREEANTEFRKNQVGPAIISGSSIKHMM